MFIRAFDVAPSVENLQHWSDPAYAYAVDKNWTVLGYSSTEARDKAVTRGYVAQIIASSQGLNLDETSSVQYLLNEKLSQGKTSATVDGYKPNDNITRAETIVFIKRLSDAGIKKLSSRPANGADVEEETTPSVTERVSKVEAAVTELLNSSAAYQNLSIKADGDELLVFGIGADRYVTFEDSSAAPTEYDVVRISKATDKAARDIATTILETLGVNITPEIKQAIEDAPFLSVDDVKDTNIDNANVDITIRPNKFSQDTVIIEFTVK